MAAPPRSIEGHQGQGGLVPWPAHEGRTSRSWGDSGAVGVGARGCPWSPDHQRSCAHPQLLVFGRGRTLVRAWARDRAGNEGVHALGTVVSDATAPVVSGVRLVDPVGAGRIAEVSYRASDGSGVGVPPGRPRVAPARPGRRCRLS